MNAPLGVDAARLRGSKVTTAPYTDISQTIATMASYCREAKDDPDLAGYVGDVLIAAGRPKTILGRVQALVKNVRENTIYSSDPAGSERVNKARVTLCLRKGEMCVRLIDCDCGTVAIVSMLLVLNIIAEIVLQDFGGGAQMHVLGRFQDESGKWIYCDVGGNAYDSDPVTGIPVGTHLPCETETYTDPMDAIPFLGLPAAEPKMVGVGAVKQKCQFCWTDDHGERACTEVPCGGSAHNIASKIVRVFGTGAASGWEPISATTGVLGPGDILRGSYFFVPTQTAPDPIGFLSTVLPELFGGIGTTYTLWAPGEALPPDWPADDTLAASEWHFQATTPIAAPVQIGNQGAAQVLNTVKAQLWVMRAAPITVPVDPGNATSGSGSVWPWVAGGTLAAIAIGVGARVLMRRRRK